MTISVTSTTAGAALPGAGTVTVAAATGDLLMVGVGLRENGSHSTTSMRVDVASIVSAAAVNYLSSGTGTPASTRRGRMVLAGVAVLSVIRGTALCGAGR